MGEAIAGTPLVSIITPTLDQGRTIEVTLESVRQQTYGRIEHIVIDGGSSDSTSEILAAAHEASGLIWRSEPDRGMYDAVNKGLRLATGDIVGYLNSDDLLLPWAIEAVVSAMERSGADVLFGDALRLDDLTNRLEVKLQAKFSRSRVARFGSLVQPAVFWRRRLHETLGEFSPDLQFVGDLDFWLRASKSVELRHLDEVLAVYRTHPAAKTSRSARLMRAEEMRIREAHGGTGGRSLPRVVAARLAHGLQIRRQLLLFAAAVRFGRGGAWRQFRAQMEPRIVWWRFALSLLPLSGRIPLNEFVKVGARPW